MPYFKDVNNKLHFLDDASFSHLLPVGCLEITESEARAIEQSLIVTLTYAQKRAAEYPPMVDYLDGVVKNDQNQIQKYINDCLAVKAKYPKK
jgi:hypothetical protein